MLRRRGESRRARGPPAGHGVITAVCSFAFRFATKRRPNPIPYGSELAQSLEMQLHEHGEIVRRELISRGRGHPRKDIYVPGLNHKTELK
jgi:hypothetical protein